MQNPKKWKKAARLLSFAGHHALDLSSHLRFDLREGRRDAAKDTAKTAFVLLREYLLSLHREFFSEPLKLKWVDTVDNVNGEEVEDYLWNLGWELRNIAAKIHNDIDAANTAITVYNRIDSERLSSIAQNAEKGYSLLRSGVERLNALLVGSSESK